MSWNPTENITMLLNYLQGVPASVVTQQAIPPSKILSKSVNLHGL